MTAPFDTSVSTDCQGAAPVGEAGEPEAVECTLQVGRWHDVGSLAERLAVAPHMPVVAHSSVSFGGTPRSQTCVHTALTVCHKTHKVQGKQTRSGLRIVVKGILIGLPQSSRGRFEGLLIGRN